MCLERRDGRFCGGGGGAEFGSPNEGRWKDEEEDRLEEVDAFERSRVGSSSSKSRSAKRSLDGDGGVRRVSSSD